MAHREQDSRMDLSGNYYSANTGLTKTSTFKIGMTEVCDDVDPGWGTDNDFTLEKVEQYIPVLVGEEVNSQGVAVKVFYSYPIGYRPIPPPATRWGIPTIWELQNLCVDVAARTSPSRCDMSVPTAIGELRDLPSLIQNAGNRALRAIASGHLSWKFCLAPMIGDLRKISRFTKAVQSRFKRLTELAERPIVTSRVPLQRLKHESSPQGVVLHSEGAYVTGLRTIKYTRQEWASIRWKLLVQPPLCVKSRYDLAERLVRGITSYGALEAAWNLQPWSWLADWFLGIGTWLQANNNTIPAIAGGFCWMCTDTSMCTYAVTQKPSWLQVTGQHFDGTTRKLRRAPGVSPLIPKVPVLPALNPGQLSILSSLALLKMRLPKRFR